MAETAASAIPASARRHGAHDSALDNGPAKDDDTLRSRLRELEEENGLLAEKATSASQRFADYENTIRVLQTQLKQIQNQQRAQQQQQAESQPSTPPQPERPGLSRFGSLMRRPTVRSPSSSFQTREQDLEAALEREQAARAEAEKKAKQMTFEIEELSATLFQQANDMVATERKENAALRGRIQALERVETPVEDGSKVEMERLRRKIRALEQREHERQKRLEKLEAAQMRIDRVRAILPPHG